MLSIPLPIITAAPVWQDEEARLDWFGSDIPDWHQFAVDERSFLLVADQSQIFEIDGAEFSRHISRLDPETPPAHVLAEFGIPPTHAVDDTPLEAPPLRALSLAVAQKCNLGCTYCYAQEGDFGGQAKAMSLDVALAAVERLFEDCAPHDRVNLSFLGGEPLLGREVLRAATQRAAQLGRERAVRVGFSITTNGTLLTPEDGDFFEQYGFAVTISIDGVGETHDRQRSFKSGRGSYEHILARLQPLLGRQRQMHVSARVTVTPRNLELPQTLDTLVGLGFHAVGFSPMLASPTGRDAMDRDSLSVMLGQMIECGRAFERRVIAGERYPFSNMGAAMQALHRGTHRPYPCGAGAGYLGVSADGDLFACHRFVNDDTAAFGDLTHGIDRARQAAWLRDRHVHRQTPCRGCWARYLCGGGCHHEVLRRGRPACDYIRGWLDYCLQAYMRLVESRADYFMSELPTEAAL